MEKLNKTDLFDWTIVECRTDEKIFVGIIDRSYMNGDGSLGVVWHSYNGGSKGGDQTTVFMPNSWQCDIVPCADESRTDKESVIFLKRIGKDPHNFDMPCQNADLYMIFSGR